MSKKKDKRSSKDKGYYAAQVFKTEANKKRRAKARVAWLAKRKPKVEAKRAEAKAKALKKAQARAEREFNKKVTETVKAATTNSADLAALVNGETEVKLP